MTGKFFSIPVKPTRYGGVTYRSRTEARWAIFFDALGVRADYEFEGFDLGRGGYLPDFWLPAQSVFLEVKPAAPSEEERAKCAEVARVTQYDMLLAEGPPRPTYQIHWFNGKDADEPDVLHMIAWDKVIECGMWLMAEDGGHRLGPLSVTTWPRGPMVCDHLEAAYAAAADARFDRSDDLGRRRAPKIGWPEERHASWIIGDAA